jgi:hypothetical protein
MSYPSDDILIHHSLHLAYHQEDCHPNRAVRQVYQALLLSGYQSEDYVFSFGSAVDDFIVTVSGSEQFFPIFHEAEV